MELDICCDEKNSQPLIDKADQQPDTAYSDLKDIESNNESGIKSNASEVSNFIEALYEGKDIDPINSSDIPLIDLSPSWIDIESGYFPSNAHIVHTLSSFNEEIPFSISQKEETTYVDERQSPTSQWLSYEYFVYLALVIVLMVYLFIIALHLSSSARPYFIQYGYTLSKGWMFHRKIDNTDLQYRYFRENFQRILCTLTAYVTLSRLVRFLLPEKNLWVIPRRFLIDLPIHCVMLYALHGNSSLIIFFIIAVNYCFAHIFRGSPLNPVFTWLWNIVILYLAEKHDGFRFSTLIGSSFHFLDHHRGILPRWHVFFKMTSLRLISYNLDYYWACRRYNHAKTNNSLFMEKHRLKCTICHGITNSETINVIDLSKESSSFLVSNDGKEQTLMKKNELGQFLLCDVAITEQPRPLHDYNPINYVVYLLYIPLFLAGPIMTFNSFISQCRYEKSSFAPSWRYKLVYGIRVAFSFFIMELMLHYIYVNAITKNRAWRTLSPVEILPLGYFLLKFVWLKLLNIWRFFRFFALVDGLCPMENMNRCMSNNYSMAGFWRSWHRSYNRWLIRYMYIPMGGAKFNLLNMWVIFSFVAFWHDLSMNLFAWGWLICLFMLPEVLCKKMFSRPFFMRRVWYRHLCALGYSFNVLLMIFANLVGFAVGVKGMRYLAAKMLKPDGIVCILIVLIFCFATINIMFEIREGERRKNSKERY